MVTIGLVELATAAVAILAAMAELLHARRCRRLARLAFGPDQRPSPWARSPPLLRVLALAALCWGLGTLLVLPPKVHVAETIPDNQRRHVLIVLDVSPSMRLKDAGPNADQSRMKRGADVMESFFQRVPVEIYLMSVVACYNGAKPVVVDTKDLEVVRNIFGDLPLHYAFTAGKTDLFSGIDRGSQDRPAMAAQEHAAADALRRRHGPGHRHAEDARLDRRRAGGRRGRPSHRVVHRRQDVASGCQHPAPDRRPAGRLLSRRQPEAPELASSCPS